MRPTRHHAIAASLIAAFALPTAADAAIPVPIHSSTMLAALATTTVVRSVDNCNDSGNGSFRQALGSALNGDLVEFSPFMTCSVITLTSGEVTSGANVDIIGRDDVRITIDGGGNSRIINHNLAGQSMRITGVDFRNGKYVSDTAAYGGCIRSSGTLSLYNVSVSGCSVESKVSQNAKGGGVYASGRLALIGSTLSGNIAASTGSGAALGGGAYSGYSLFVSYSSITSNLTGDNYAHSKGGGLASLGSLNMLYSLVKGNSSDIGGGIYATVHPVTSTTSVDVTNSTISGNTAQVRVGGLFANTDFVGTTSTIAFNKENTSGISGAGLYVKGSRALYNLIIAKNLSVNTESDFGAFVLNTVMGDHNLIMHANRPVPADTLTSDPLLAPLADNGGPTHTHALMTGSPAIDHGNSSYPSNMWDQRGPTFKRNVGTRDIGAYERDTDIIFASGFN